MATRADVFCHPLPAWPDDAEIIEEIPIEACWRAGVAVHLVLRRARQRRSLFVWTRKGERTLVFWRSEASMRRETPGIRVPLDRAPFEPARGGDRGNRVDQSFRGAALWCHAEHCCRRSRGARERGASPHHGRRNETTLRGTIVPDATLPRTRGC